MEHQTWHLHFRETTRSHDVGGHHPGRTDGRVQDMVGMERFVLALQSEGRKSVEADWQVISQFSDFREGSRP